MRVPRHVLYRLVFAAALATVIASARPEPGLRAAALGTTVPGGALTSIPPAPFVVRGIAGRVDARDLALPGGPWQRVRRGFELTEERALRTGPKGHAALTRGEDVIQLDAATELTLETLSQERVKLRHQDGNALYEVHPRANRRFQVVAPHLVITAPGGAFSVILEEGSTAVAVSEGQVTVDVTFTGERVELATGELGLLASPMERLEVHGDPGEGSGPSLRRESRFVREARREAGRLIRWAAWDGLGAPRLYDFESGTYHDAGDDRSWRTDAGREEISRRSSLRD